MSIRRLVATAAAMALIAVVLAGLTPGLDSMAGSVAAPQRTADTAGPDVVVLSVAGLAAWAVWGWGVMGLGLTAASALPGLLGGAARVALHVVLPEGARRSAALVLGVGLGVVGPLVATGAPSPQPPGAAAETWMPASATGSYPEQPTAPPVPDWSTPTQPDGPPDWPPAPPRAGSHVVVPGDCLWHIAGDRLAALHGRPATDGDVATATEAWWRANADVIGPDPDLLLPGQVLFPPDPP